MIGKWRNFPGHRFEIKVAKKLDKKVGITDFRKKYIDRKNGNKIGETDIKVKKYKARDLMKQLDKYKKLTKKEPIGFAPKILKQNEKKIKEKYKLFKDLPSLKSYLIKKGTGKKEINVFSKITVIGGRNK